MPVAVAEPSLGERVRQGDPAAFEALYQEYAPGIFDFLARLTHDRAAAEDLTQTTFIKAFEHRASLRDPEKVRAWLWTTAHNQAINHLARQRKSDPLDEQFDLATLARSPEESAEAKDTSELVWLAAASLEPRQYAVLDLTVRRDLSTQEVAETLGVPAGHAAVLVNRAREALGNAVRYLLVARRREQCPQLAALVPAGIRSLTPEQRSAVDHHMRRCEQCRALADRLTTPAELLGGIVLLPLPARLVKLDWSHMLNATRPVPQTPAAPRRPKGRQTAQHAARTAGQHAVASSIQVVVTLAVAVALTVPQAGSKPPVAPTVALAATHGQPSKVPTGVKLASTAAPTGSAQASGQASGPTGTGVNAGEQLIAVAEGGLPATGAFFSTTGTTVHLLRPDGTEVDTLSLKAGLRILAVAGPRIFVLEPGGVLRAIKADGTVEDLGTLGTDLSYSTGGAFVVNSDGTQWLWSTSTGTFDFSQAPVKTMHSSIHLAGIGLPGRVVYQADEVNQAVAPWAWPPSGPVIGNRILCCGLGGGPVAFGTPYFLPEFRLDLGQGTATRLPQLTACPPAWDFNAAGVSICGAPYASSPGAPTLLLPDGRKLPITLPSWTYQAGDAYLSPKAPVVAIGVVGPTDANSSPLLPFGQYETYLVSTANGAMEPLRISGVLPALWQQWALSSWLPDGSLMVFRQPGASGGDPGTYVVTPSGKVTKVSSLGPPIGVIQATVPGSGPTAAQAAQAAADALLKQTGDLGCKLTLDPAVSGVNASYVTGHIDCAGLGIPGFTAFIYLYQDTAGWHFIDARGTQGGFEPAIGKTGTVRLSSGYINVRDAATLSGRIVSKLTNGTTVTVDGGPSYADQKLWWHLKGLGWVAHDYLICAADQIGLMSQQC